MRWLQSTTTIKQHTHDDDQNRKSNNKSRKIENTTTSLDDVVWCDDLNREETNQRRRKRSHKFEISCKKKQPCSSTPILFSRWFNRASVTLTVTRARWQSRFILLLLLCLKCKLRGKKIRKEKWINYLACIFGKAQARKKIFS